MTLFEKVLKEFSKAEVPTDNYFFDDNIDQEDIQPICDRALEISKSKTKPKDIPLDILMSPQNICITGKVNELMKNDAWKKEPITVVIKDGTYYIGDGNHRAAAAHKLGAKTISAKIGTF